MTYTRVWDNTAPLGSVLDANDIDGEFRRLKLDIAERWSTLFTTTMASTTIDSMEDVLVKASKTSWYLRMSQAGLVSQTSILAVDQLASGVSRITHGSAGGGVNWAWTILPNTSTANFPAYEVGLNGLVAVNTQNGELVYYSSGARWAVGGTPF